MKHFLLLLLLTSWTHLGSSAHRCNTGVVISGHILNIKGSRTAKANVAFTHAYNSSSIQICLEECCSGTYGSCSVATYKKNSDDFDCLHFDCRPLAKCKFLAFEGSDSYTFPGTSLSLHEIHSEVLSSDAPHVEPRNETDQKDHPRSVAARKGVENVLVTRKGVLSNVLVPLDFALKDDNTTVKPRKGVDFVTQSSYAPPVLTSLNSVIASDIDASSADTFGSRRAKIKPRKGVELFPSLTSKSLQPSLELTSSAYDHGLWTKSAWTNSHVSTASFTKDNELISLLQNVFRDELHSATGMPSDSSVKSDWSPGSDLSTAATHLHITAPYFPTPTVQSKFVSTTGEVEPVPETTSTSASPVSFETAYPRPMGSGTTVSNSLRDSTVYPSITFEGSVVTRYTISATQALSDVRASAIAEKDQESLLSINNLRMPSPTRAESTSAPSVHKTFSSSEEIVGTNKEQMEKSAAEIENERRYKSSMHLVLSLVFGLLVLCAVLGAVAKRIYDVWLRRHYHRMDFLIDGMYD